MIIEKFFQKLLGLIKREYLKLKYPQFALGKNSKIDFNTRIKIQKNKLFIGENVYLRSRKNGYHAGMPFVTSLLIDQLGGAVEIGDNCRINGCYIHAQNRIRIGANTVIASGTNILDSNGHETYSKDRTIGRDIPEPIEIGSNVWIGLNSIILKGTSIGNNSIVSAGSVVRGEFPENSLIQGNPGKLIKILKIE